MGRGYNKNWVLYPDSRSQDCEGMSVKVRGGVRLMQDGRSARAQRRRQLITVQFTRQITRDTSVDSSERDGAEFEIDTLLNRQPVQLPPKLSRKCTMRRLCYRDVPWSRLLQ